LEIDSDEEPDAGGLDTMTPAQRIAMERRRCVKLMMMLPENICYGGLQTVFSCYCYDVDYCICYRKHAPADDDDDDDEMMMMRMIFGYRICYRSHTLLFPW